MMKKLTFVFLIWIGLFNSAKLSAQACSCGGAPLLSSLEFPSTSSGTWQFGLTYEFSSISDLVTETEQLDDDTRLRRVHTGLLEISYGINDRWSASVLLTLLQQERRTSPGFGIGRDLLRTRGIGDALLLAKYNLLPTSIFHQHQLTIGGGVKVPLGESSLRTNGTLISADMQPGTGAWDGVLWGNYYLGLSQARTTGLLASASYRITSTNDRFGSQNEGYRFGNEFVSTAGFNYRPRPFIDFDMALRFRSVEADRFANQETPNTGGRWLNLLPGINLNVAGQFTFRLTGQIPVYRNLNGTQLTTDYTSSISILYTLNRARKVIDLL